MCRVRDLSHWNREVTSLVNGFRWPINMQDMIVAKRHAQLVSSISTLVRFQAPFQLATIKIKREFSWVVGYDGFHLLFFLVYFQLNYNSVFLLALCPTRIVAQMKSKKKNNVVIRVSILLYLLIRANYIVIFK